MLAEAFDRTYVGLEAVQIYRLARDFGNILDLTEKILTISYRIHLGKKGEQFIIDSFNVLRTAIVREEMHLLEALFEQRRRECKSVGLFSNRPAYKEGSLNRSIKIAGKENFRGTVVDVGADDNSLGKILLRHCRGVSNVIGIDIEKRITDPDSESLKFIEQHDPCELPLDNNCADSLVFRFSLHHMSVHMQRRILTEAYRVLRSGGRIIIFEDTYSSTIPAIANNIVHEKVMQLREKIEYKILLSFLDASSCFAIKETMPFCFSFRSLEEWSAQLEKLGYDKKSIEYWGIPFFSLFQAPLGVLVFEKG